MQRARPASASVKRDAGIADVELARMRRRRRQAVELRVDLPLVLDCFGEIFLYPIRPSDRVFERRDVRDARAHPGDIGNEPMACLLREARRDERPRGVELRGNGIVETHAPAGPREDHCPRPADQPGANDCRCLVHRLTFSGMSILGRQHPVLAVTRKKIRQRSMATPL